MWRKNRFSSERLACLKSPRRESQKHRAEQHSAGQTLQLSARLLKVSKKHSRQNQESNFTLSTTITSKFKNFKTWITSIVLGKISDVSLRNSIYQFTWNLISSLKHPYIVFQGQLLYRAELQQGIPFIHYAKSLRRKGVALNIWQIIVDGSFPFLFFSFLTVY